MKRNTEKHAKVVHSDRNTVTTMKLSANFLHSSDIIDKKVRKLITS